MAVERDSHRLLVGAAVAGLALQLGGCGDSDDPPAGRAEPAAVVSSASGAFTLTTFPGDAQAGLRFADFVTEGRVVIENDGQRAGSFAVRQKIDFEDPSAGARKASAGVGLRILDATGKGRPRELYRGSVAGLDSVPVGEIGAGASREYSFKLTPRTPLRASRLDLSYRWTPASAASAPADRTEPAEKPPPRLRVRLRIPSEQRLLDTRRILVFARCSRRCRVEARATLRAPSRAPIDLPVAPRRSSPEHPARLALRATGKAFPVMRAALIEGPPVAVRLRVSARGDDGGSAVVRERVRLKPVPDRRRKP